MKTKDSQIIFLINQATKDDWQTIAKDNNISLSSLIITAVNQYVRGLK
jgi:uncharacterized protein YdbL (DUF1318 family)